MFNGHDSSSQQIDVDGDLLLWVGVHDVCEEEYMRDVPNA
jgi:hypothetical protein